MAPPPPPRNASQAYLRRMTESRQTPSTKEEIQWIYSLITSTTPSLVMKENPSNINTIIRMIENSSNATYNRALAARALGLIIESDMSLKGQIKYDTDKLTDALLQIINECRHADVQNSDTRRIHVNCCLVISLIMQGPYESIKSAVNLHSPLIAMQIRPSEKDSRFLLKCKRQNSQRDTYPEDDVIQTKQIPPQEEFHFNNETQNTHSQHEKKQKKIYRISKKAMEDNPYFCPGSASKNTRTPSRALIFGSEPLGKGLTNEGNTLSVVDFEGQFVGYNNRKLFYPHDRPQTESSSIPNKKPKSQKVLLPKVSNSILAKSQGNRKLSIFDKCNKSILRPQTSLMPDRSVKESMNETAPIFPSSSLILPSKMFTFPNEPDKRPFILQSNNMLEIFKTNQMPVSQPGSRASGQRTSNTAKSRIAEVDFHKWFSVCEDNSFTEILESDNNNSIVTVKNLQSIHANHSSNESDLYCSMNNFQVDDSRVENENSCIAAEAKKKTVSNEKKYSPRQRSSKQEESQNLDINSKEYKRCRLLAILNVPIESINSNVVSHVAHSEHSNVMNALSYSLKVVRNQEKQISKKMLNRINYQRKTLPLKFLFQLPGGIGFCRERMRNAILLWISEFERNQQRLAWLQWKAFYESGRYIERRGEYIKQGAAKRLSIAMKKVVRALYNKVYRKWVQTVQFFIWMERDQSVRNIQKCLRRHFALKSFLKLHDDQPIGGQLRDFCMAECRNLPFQIPVRVRQERREIWAACIAVQAPFRGRRFRKFMKRKRDAAIKLQSLAKMRQLYLKYNMKRQCIIKLQSIIRMYITIQPYKQLKLATSTIQQSYRGLRGRRLFSLMLLAQRRILELQITAALKIQRIFRGFQNRQIVRAIRKQDEDEFWAALVFQRCWYSYKNEWVTFLLLGCLRERDREEKEWLQEINSYFRHAKVRVIQKQFREFRELRRHFFAIRIQCCYRRYAAMSLMNLKRKQRMAHRRIKWFGRVHNQRRKREIKKIQFWWRKAVPGRFLDHLVRVSDNLNRVREEEENQKNYDAAAKLQATVRGSWARYHYKRLLAVINIQRTFRGYLGRRYAHKCWLDLRFQAAFNYMTDVLDSCTDAESTRLFSLYTCKAIIIQSTYRGCKCRDFLVKQWVRTNMLTEMAIRIQKLWRRNTQKRFAKKLLAAQKRKRNNIYKYENNILLILKKSREESLEYFDPYDDAVGISLPMWLRRLGLEYLIETCRRSKICTVKDISNLAKSEKEMTEKLSLNSKDDKILIESMCNASIWIEASKIQRIEVGNLERKVKDEESSLKHLLHEDENNTQTLQLLEQNHFKILEENKDRKKLPKSIKMEVDNLMLEIDKLKELSNNIILQMHSKEEYIKLLKSNHAKELTDLKKMEEKERKAIYVQRFFRYISDPKELTAAFLEKFPKMETKSKIFCDILKDTPLSTFQLNKFLEHDSPTPAQALANVSKLVNFSYKKESIQYDNQRKFKCCDVLQYAVERVSALLGLTLDRILQQLYSKDEPIYEIIVHTLGKSQVTTLPNRPLVWRSCVDNLIQMSLVATKVQKLWHSREARKLVSLLKKQRKIQELKEVYSNKINENNIQLRWEEKQKKEKQEYEEWIKQQEMYELQLQIESVPCFFFEEYWDHQCQNYYYIDTRTGDYIWVKPKYNLTENSSVITIQKIVRKKLGRLFLKRLKRQREREEKFLKEKRIWESKWTERQQYYSVRIRLETSANEHVSKWEKVQLLEKKRNSRHVLPSKIMNSQFPKVIKKEIPVETINIWSSKQRKLQGHFNDYEARYHCSVYKAFKLNSIMPSHSKELNIYGEAILDVLTSYSVLRREMELNVDVEASFKYTKVEHPIIWEKFYDEESDLEYYHNIKNGEVTWEKPEYSFEEENAARKLQSAYKMLLGRRAVQDFLRGVSFVDNISRAILQASKIGWIGMGFEGMSVTMYLLRLGFYSYVPAMSSVNNLNDLLKLKESQLINNYNWKPKDAFLLVNGPKRKKLSKPLTENSSLGLDANSGFSFISTDNQLSQILTSYYGNQQGRIMTLVNLLKSSKTPISIAQLEAFLKEYPKSAKAAADNIKKIIDIKSVTQYEDENQIFSIFKHIVTRCGTFAANLKLDAMSETLKKIIEIVKCIHSPLSNSSLLYELNDQQILFLNEVLKEEDHTKGLWENDFRLKKKLSLAQACFILRKYGMEYVLKWIRSAEITQASYKMHQVRRWYLETVAYRNISAQLIQMNWKVSKAINLAKFLKVQQHSTYEELYDDENDCFYYFSSEIGEALWEPPIDQNGLAIPYRPLVFDHSTKKWIQAWPYLDKNQDEDEINAFDNFSNNSALCSICYSEEATRVCQECYSPDGDYIYYCFACFNLEHVERNPAISWHAYQPLNKMEAESLLCVECYRLSTLYCLNCKDHYCERCFARLHRKGHRAKHSKEFYEKNALACVECEERTAFYICEVCEDALCENCAKSTHSKGNKQTHKMNVIPQPLLEGDNYFYCEQCKGRCTDQTCQYCKKKICSVCFQNNHQTICAEFALEKRKNDIIEGNRCVECGKLADRKCDVCGDKYCTVRWMGNPGCFEKFHSKGNRTQHKFSVIETPEIPAEVLEMEKILKEKRRVEALQADKEAQQFAAELAKEEELKKSEAMKTKPNKSYELEVEGQCATIGCFNEIFAGMPYCMEHCTPQNIVLVTGDPLKAAQIINEASIALVNQKNNKGMKKKSTFSLTGLSSMLNSGTKKKFK